MYVSLFLPEEKNIRSRLVLTLVSVSQLAMGKMMDQGPVLIITFQAQLVMVIRNPKGEVVEGDPVSSSFSVHTMCRVLWV